jgi:hypothetical protein
MSASILPARKREGGVIPRRINLALAGLAVSAAVGAALWPHAYQAGAVIAAQEDPGRLSELQIASVLQNDPARISRSIEDALAADDPDLAASFVALAQDRRLSLDETQMQRVTDAVQAENAPTSVAKRFATGLVTGQADDVASLSGTVAGDLFVFGDIRDAVREGKHLLMGEETDRLILGLAAAGLAVTAATYASAGTATPVRAGLSLVKDARKVGRLGEGLAAWAGRSAREVVDAPLLQRAVASGSVLRPGETATAIRAAFRAEKAGALVRLAKDVGRITEKVGTRGALDSLKIAEGPKDIARAARLAETKGGQTRAILKLLGRGALLLTAGAFNLAIWLFGALMTLLGVLASIKSMTERTTQAWLDRRKRRRLRQLQAAQAAAAGPELVPAATCG